MSILSQKPSFSELNPAASEFVPSWMMGEGSLPTRHLDQAMREFHHLVVVNDTESLEQARGWDGAPVDELVDVGVAEALDLEDTLRDRLHCPPNRPQGDTSGRQRARGRHRSPGC